MVKKLLSRAVRRSASYGSNGHLIERSEVEKNAPRYLYNIYLFLKANWEAKLYAISKCQTINVEIVFDEFEIRNITYNPKFESLEVFSAIGGYMGIYLGASIVTFYDLVEIAVAAVLKYTKKRRKANKKRENRKKRAWMYDVIAENKSSRRHRKRKNQSSRRIRNIY
ncbi:hypothetical protein AVEN_31399-1 [Araneus ventricosus]|uniref:Uncharacterized protein n=1 Tax=Araneus ventricosus TaxID=182803 RepID=A0A4Y2F6E4_ARAVE|nr:hypothetical protein AVEN_31399-1 [Araneus ventricosus]